MYSLAYSPEWTVVYRNGFNGEIIILIYWANISIFIGPLNIFGFYFKSSNILTEPLGWSDINVLMYSVIYKNILERLIIQATLIFLADILWRFPQYYYLQHFHNLGNCNYEPRIQNNSTILNIER